MILLRVSFSFTQSKGIINGSRFEGAETIKGAVTTEPKGHPRKIRPVVVVLLFRESSYTHKMHHLLYIYVFCYNYNISIVTFGFLKFIL